MTDNEKLDLILSKLGKLDTLESDMQGMKDDMKGMKDDMQGMKDDMQELKRRTTNIELHLENITDNNVQMIAENFIALTDKLNEAIPAVDKNLAYEVKVNYLVREVNKLKEEVAELKNKIA